MHVSDGGREAIKFLCQRESVQRSYATLVMLLLLYPISKATYFLSFPDSLKQKVGQLKSRSVWISNTGDSRYTRFRCFQ